MSKSLYDILIIGAGPAGSYTAQQLAARGYKVAVFEEHGRIGEPMQCTGIISVECFERFGLSKDCVLREACSATLFSPSGRGFRLHRDAPQAYIVDRGAFDRTLAGEAQSRGAQYFTSCRVSDVQVSGDGVSLRTEGGEAFDGRVAVIAAGFYSKLPQRLGMGRAGDFITGAQAEVTIKESSELEEIEIYFDQRAAPGFFAWLVPTRPHTALVGLFARRYPRRYLQAFIADLFERGRIASTEAAIVPGGIPLKAGRRSYGERLIVVGDAAGQVKPTTGGGVYFGLLCADAAVAILGNAFDNDDFSKQALSAYQDAWHNIIGRELRNGYAARRLYERLSNRSIERLFGMAHSRNLAERLSNSQSLSFDWHNGAIKESLKLLIPRI